MRSFNPRKYGLVVLFVGGIGLPSGAALPLQEGARHLEQAIEVASLQGDYTQVQSLRLELAHHWAAAGHYGEAARQYELLLAARPPRKKRIALFVQLGHMRVAMQDYGKALDAYGDALHDDRSSWEANMAMARAYAHVDLNSRAVEAYQRCIRLRPPSYEPYQEMAEIYQRMGHLNKAISFYEKALRRSSRPEAYLGMADCYVRQDNIPKATEILQRAKTLLPRVDYDVRLGDIYEKKGDLLQAAKAWEEALKSDARRDDIRLHLAVVYNRLNRRSDSDRLFKVLLNAYPSSPLVHFLRAWVLYDRGEFPASRHEALTVQHWAPTELVRYYNERLLEELRKY